MKKRQFLKFLSAGALTLTVFCFSPLYPADAAAITDMAGRKVNVPDRIAKVGTIGAVPQLNMLLAALGAQDMLANKLALSFDDKKTFRMQHAFIPGLKDKEAFQSSSHELLPENILHAAPEILITNMKAMAPAAEKAGIPVIIVDTSNLKLLKESLRLLGDLLGKSDRAEELIEEMIGTGKEIRTYALEDADTPTVLFANPSQGRFPNPGVEAWLKDLGINSATAPEKRGKAKSFSTEDLLLWDPDVIFVSYSKMVPELKAHPALKGLKAVKNNKVFIVPIVGTKYGGFNAEMPAADIWIASKLFPDKMPDSQAKSRLESFYKTFFNYPLSDAEAAWILKGADS